MTAKATAFALIGDRYHNSDYIRTALTKTLVEGTGIRIDFSDEVKQLNAETLKDYRVLIIFRDGMVWPEGYGEHASWAGQPVVSDPPVLERPLRCEPWITPEQGRTVADFIRGGGAALFYHNSTYIATYDENFRDALGAATEGHPPVRPFKVQITASDHFIVRGLGDFVVTDEQHYMSYDKDPQYVFMRSASEEGLDYKGLGPSCEAGWAYEYGEGRVCYLAPGHTIPALWNPTYEKIQQNALRWLLRQF